MAEPTASMGSVLKGRREKPNTIPVPIVCESSLNMRLEPVYLVVIKILSFKQRNLTSLYKNISLFIDIYPRNINKDVFLIVLYLRV